jgi:hypothetical protein
MKKDLRAYDRRIPLGNVYAALGRKYERMGKLIDLSLGGLAFEYITGVNSSLESSQINIFKVGEVFNLHNLPCRIVYDIPLPPVRDGIESLKRSRNRRCGVNFDNLLEESYVNLTLFLESHTKNDLNL